MRPVFKVLVLVGALLAIWSALFGDTFRLPFYWDDFHLIRHYNAAEVRSVFHGLVDPDKIETPGLRPVSILLYNLQGSLCGENIVAHRIFMVGLMGILLFVVAILFLEAGLQFFQIAIVLTLFVCSRVFAALVLWISLSHLILAYIFIVLTAYFFLCWVKSRQWLFFIAMLACALIATFTREETYTMPLALPILWALSASDRTRWREVVLAAISIFVIVAFHYWLWHFLIPEALSPQFTLAAIKRLLTAIEASWLPGGYTMHGFTDKLIGWSWVGFLVTILFVFIVSARPRVRWQLFGTCCLGALLCLPAIGVGRSFGIALPTLAFMAAVSIAIREMLDQTQFGGTNRRWPRYAIVTLIFVGLLIGISGGIRRSRYVVESLQENCAVRIVRDGKFLFNLFDRPATIPDERRKLGLARLKHFGIQSAEDLKQLETAVRENLGRFAGSGRGARLFLSNYDYLSY